MEQAQLIGLALGLGTLGILMVIIFFKANIVLCQPNELVVIAGRRRKLADGTRAGYRVMRGGRGFKLPLFESVARMSLTSQQTDLGIERAMCSGMIPVDIQAKASVKLAGDEASGMDAAIERFLGRGSEAVVKASKQAIEGALRGVIATVTAEDANANRLQLAADAAEHARADLRRLGIVLDFLQIQGISDNQGYLEAIGRKRSATVKRDARIAEAQTEAESRSVAAEQMRIGREAEIAAEMSVMKRENALLVERAQHEADSNRARERALVAGDVGRTEEQIELETLRVRLAEQRELADTIEPAKARRAALLLEAEGRAARIHEEGKATAQAVGMMREQWQDESSRELFVLRMFPDLVDKVSRVVAENLNIDKLTILDGGDGGGGLPTHVKNLTKSAITVIEQLENATGIDLAKPRKHAGKPAAKLPPELD